MKSKFGLMWRVAVALVLVLSFSLVAAAPASADVSAADVTVAPTQAGQPAKYTVEFTTSQYLLGTTGEIYIEFPTDTDVTGYTGTVTVNGATADSVGASGQTVTITVALDVSPGTVTVVLDKDQASKITNPTTAGDYTLKVSTSRETIKIASNPYTITPAAPTIVSVGPLAANQGETLDVYIKGTDFVEGATVSFSGTGVTSTEVSVVDETIGANDYLIATVTIASDAEISARDVTVTTTAGSSEPFSSFTVNAEGTLLVDGFDSTAGGEAELEAAGWLLYKTCSEVDIQDAIGGVGGGGAWANVDTLRVHAATYPETITIDVPGLTVESIMGAASTIIDAKALDPAGVAATMHCAAVMITAEGVTFGGTDKGFTVKDAGLGVDAGGVGTASTLWADDNSDGIADVTGVYIWPNGGTNAKTGSYFDRVSVIGNTIYGSQARGIRADVADGTYTESVVCVYIAENTVYDNLFEGFSGDGLGNDDASIATIIEDNEFRNNGPSGAGWTDAGIEINGSADTVYISGNDIHDNVTAGIHLFPTGGHTIGTLTIEQNTIHDNGSYGIRTSAGTPTNITCNYNDIYGNTDWGINNSESGSGDVNAKYNWWGAIGGPSTDPGATPPTAYGEGDAISAGVTYDPWLTETQSTTVTDGIAYHGSIMELDAAGWNTLSVPLKLKDSANTMAEIAALGDFLTDTNWEIAYQYNPAIPGWENIGTSAIDLVPCRGYYIKTVEAVSFPVLYSGQLGLPAFELDAGWNLIGSAFGVGTTDYEINGAATMAVDDALDSIAANCSVIVSPTVPGQTADWATTMAAEISSPTYNMTVGEGYWVFMTASGTLAGFQVTPIYWIAP